MYPHQRERVAAAFQAAIRGQNGCLEQVVSASECEHGSLHLGLVDGYMEGQLGGETAPAGPYVTGLLNEAMPLLRYDLGDSLSVGVGERCRCGRTLPMLAPVVTRQQDLVVTPSGRWLSPSTLSVAFHGVEGLRTSQVIQRGRAEIEVLVDVDPHDYGRVAETLVRRLREHTFGEMQVKITRAGRVPVQQSGKTRFVVNEYLPGVHGH
jgi:phenylacetate-CoA ligase